MFEICRFLAATAPKAKKARKPAAKAIRVGATVRLSLDGKTYTVKARDDRFKNAWFLDGPPYSFSRDMLAVL
jgi:hypothetical protein